MRVEIELRCLPRYRIINYLVELGGKETESLCVTGDRWSAELVALEPDRIGIVDVPRDRLVIRGDAPAVQRVADFMRLKVEIMRKGG